MAPKKNCREFFKCKCSSTDKFATVLLMVIIVTVIIALLIVGIAELISSSTNEQSKCNFFIHSNHSSDICGNSTGNTNSTSNQCIFDCSNKYNNQLSMIYYIPYSNSTIPNCYCLTKSQLQDIENTTVDKYDDICMDLYNFTEFLKIERYSNVNHCN